jgi:predicted PurR-regulated permease PerM
MRRSDIVFAFAVLIGIYVAWLARDVLLLVYVSALFAVVIGPAVGAIQRIHIGRWRPGRGLAILTILFAGAALFTLFSLLALPPIFHDLQAFSADWPHRVSELTDRAKHIPFVNRINPASLQEYISGAAGDLAALLKGFAGGLFWFISGLILTSYFILDGEGAFHWTMSLFPQRQRARLEPTLIRAEQRMRNWLVGQFALMALIGCCSAVVFWLLHVRYFYFLAVFAGVMNIVPVVGHLASFLLAATVAGMDSWTKLLGVTIFYLIYTQIVEGAFLQPRIMQVSVDLPPLAVIIALSLGATLEGVLGALVSVPTAAVVAVFLDEYLVKPNEAPAAPRSLGAADG